MTGDNGVLTKAKEAKENTEKAQIIEDIKLKIYDKQSENLGNITENEIIEIIKKYGTISDNKLTTTKGKYEIELKDISDIFKKDKYKGKKYQY